MTNRKTVIFDMDGGIVDSEKYKIGLATNSPYRIISSVLKKWI